MRVLTAEEKKKRGCVYCANMAMKWSAHHGGLRRSCPHTECPYTVLDKYETYEDYMQSKDSEINITALLEADWSAGRVTPGAREYFPILRRIGKDGPF